VQYTWKTNTAGKYFTHSGERASEISGPYKAGISSELPQFQEIIILTGT
jgi:hypothetical protein